MVIAPVFERMPEREQNVVRIPAIQHFNGSDFSVVLPLSRSLSTLVDGFAPDIIHSHHPFLLGGTALRLARGRNLPLVFTHHTMYEPYRSEERRVGKGCGSTCRSRGSAE